MLPPVRLLLAFAVLLTASDAGRDKVLFGINSPHDVRLKEIILDKVGGLIKVKNYCPNGTPKGEMVVVSNSHSDRTPYIDGSMFNVKVICKTLGPFATCHYPIGVNITQFC